MVQPIFITSHQHTNEELKALLSSMSVAEKPVIQAKAPVTRSVTEALNFVADNTETILTVLGSIFTAWKLYQEQQKLQLERRKHELNAEKFDHEKKQWEIKQNATQPKQVKLYIKNGEQLILPFGIKEEDFSYTQLHTLRECSVSQLEKVEIL